MRRALLTLCALMTLGCNDLTEILVVVHSDLRVPDEMDAVRVEVTGSETMAAGGGLVGDTGRPLPRTVGVVRTGGRVGPLRIRAIGTLRGSEVVSRQVDTSFVVGQVRVLEIGLQRICVARVCDAGETCVGGECVPTDLNPNSLPEYNGQLPPFDAGSCPEETCNDTDDDCDGRVDEGFMLDSNPNSCGQCGRVCDFPNATAGCAFGECTIATCDDGFDNCNGDLTDGCERNVRSLTDCGACDMACDLAGATETCAGGFCAIETCDAGLGDCNMDPTDGCEASLDTLTDCGSCGTPCDAANGSETCATGTCELVMCDAGFDDCNMDPSDGCETSLTTLTDCGSCGTACAVADGTATCATGTCEVAMCDSDFGDCNMDPTDGCEESLRFNDMFCGDCMTACVAPDRCQNVTCR